MGAEVLITVFVVDDDEAVRDSIRMLLEAEGLTTKCFAGGKEFFDYYRSADKGCLILDMLMPEMNGLAVLDKLNLMEAPLPVVFITGHGDIPMAVEAMRRGAVNFIRKPFTEEELLSCVDEALSLDRQKWRQQEGLVAMRHKVSLLTPRELEVFERVTVGQANKVIAIELGISERTVEIHRGKVMHKTDSRSLTDLVRLRIGLE